jgi:hypothetical protein
MSVAQVGATPSHVSLMSHSLAAPRQVVPLLSDWQVPLLQHASRALHVAPDLNVHVAPLQHESTAEQSSAPQSQSSPSWRRPSPHTGSPHDAVAALIKHCGLPP